MAKAKQTIERTWRGLNKALESVKTSKKAKQMLDLEVKQPSPRRGFALRIHSKLNRLRAAEERTEIIKKCR